MLATTLVSAALAGMIVSARRPGRWTLRILTVTLAAAALVGVS